VFLEGHVWGPTQAAETSHASGCEVLQLKHARACGHLIVDRFDVSLGMPGESVAAGELSSQLDHVP
jgi:hypothetical protein